MSTKNNIPANQKVVVRESISGSLNLIALLTLFIGYALYDNSKYIERIGLLIYLAIICSLLGYLFYRLYVFAKREVVMAIGPEGIFYKKSKFMRWDDILSIKRTNRTSGDSTMVVLLFQTSHSAEPYEIGVSGLDRSEKKLIELIRQFRDYNIVEVVRNEWPSKYS